MLLDDCHLLKDKIADLKTVRVNSENIGLFQQVHEQLKTAIVNTKSLNTTLELFKKKKIGVSNLPSYDASTLQEELSEVYSTYKKNADGIVRDKTLREILNNKLPWFNPKVNEALVVAWQQYTYDKVRKVDSASLAVLGTIPQFKSTIKNIHELQQDIGRIHSTLPMKDTDIYQFDKKADELSQKWQMLDAEGIPESVVVFLRAVGSGGGASLDLLTDEVRNWLMERSKEPGCQDIMESFRVFIRQSV